MKRSLPMTKVALIMLHFDVINLDPVANEKRERSWK